VSDTVTVNASDSRNADKFRWDFDGDDRTDAVGVEATWSYDESGVKEIDLFVKKQNGENDSLSRTISVRPSNTTATPTPTVTATATPTSSPTPTPTATPTPDAGGGAAGGSNGGSTPGADGGSQTVDRGDSNATYSLSELRDGGDQLPGNDPSLRILGDGPQAMSLIHWPADEVLSDPGTDNNWLYVSPSTTVGRNSLYLRHFSIDGTDSPYTLKIAYWKVGEQRYETDSGEVVTRQVAQNVTVDTVEVGFDAGFPATQKIDLRQSDDTRRVTMWIEGEPGVRWTFEHESIATTQAVEFTSWGGLLESAAWWWFLPLFIGAAIAAWGAKKLIERAGRFVGWGYSPWIAAFAIGGGLTALFAPVQAARAVVRYPWLLALAIVAFVTVLTLETLTDGVRRVRFVKDHLHERKSPSGDRAVESVKQTEKELTLVDRPDQPVHGAADGFRAFAARCAGARAPVKTVKPSEEADDQGELNLNQDPLQTTVDIENGTVDEEIYVNPRAPGVVDYQREGWTWETPSPDDRSDMVKYGAGAVVLGLAALTVGQALSWVLGAGVAAAGIVALSVEPVNGRIRVWPAPFHYRTARASQRYLAKELDDAETIEEVQDRRIEEEMTTEREKMEAVDKADNTRIQAMFGPGDEEDDEENERNPVDALPTEDEASGRGRSYPEVNRRNSRGRRGRDRDGRNGGRDRGDRDQSNGDGGSDE
jgi:hypothetical protein